MVITREPLASGDNERSETDAPPALWPNIVILQVEFQMEFMANKHKILCRICFTCLYALLVFSMTFSFHSLRKKYLLAGIATEVDDLLIDPSQSENLEFRIPY